MYALSYGMFISNFILKPRFEFTAGDLTDDFPML